MNTTLLRAIPESSWQRTVITCAMLNGWRVHLVPDALYRRSFAVSKHGANQGDKGFPDLILCRPPRIVAIEVKAEAGRIRPEQQQWLDELSMVEGVETYIWRPRDWSEVEKVLSR